MERQRVAYWVGLTAMLLPFPILILTVGVGTWIAASITFGVPLVLQATVGPWSLRQM